MKSKFTLILLFVWAGLFGQVPNHNHFTLGHVFFAVYGDSAANRTTATLFYDSDAAKFDATYGSKTMNPQTINGFRNYGYIVLPTVTISTIWFLTATTADGGGNVTSDGGATVTARGLCWSTSSSPTTANSHTSDGTGTGSFTSSITGINANTTYYVRAYATNSVGTSYSSETTYISTLQVGQSYQGGIVAYISGSNGLIMSSVIGSSEWGCSGSSLGSYQTAIGTGAANTSIIVSGCATVGIPARLCDDLVLNGYSDWYLPSRDEAMKMWDVLYLTESNITYWTSSEGSYSFTYANRVINSSSGEALKTNTFYVRAMRSF